MWCQWSVAWPAAARARWGPDPMEPVFLVLNNASTRADLSWTTPQPESTRLTAANGIHGVALPTHLINIMQPVRIC
jgi:hypothetical protein